MVAPHPLAERLIERLQDKPKGFVLDFASGSGRNGEALRRAGFTVVTVPDRAAADAAALTSLRQRFAAVVSSHGLLHGDLASIRDRVRAIANALEDDGLLYATFGSTQDARFGRGVRVTDATFAPADGDERGIAHTYFDREGLLALLEPEFEAESLDQQRVDDVAGRWAHPTRPLAGAVHWFAVARKR